MALFLRLIVHIPSCLQSPELKAHHKHILLWCVICVTLRMFTVSWWEMFVFATVHQNSGLLCKQLVFVIFLFSLLVCLFLSWFLWLVQSYDMKTEKKRKSFNWYNILIWFYSIYLFIYFIFFINLFMWMQTWPELPW